MTTWRPTHEITFTPEGESPRAIPVMVTDGVAYTRDEWESESAADWEVVDGEFLFQGRAAPSSGTVGVRTLVKLPFQFAGITLSPVVLETLQAVGEPREIVATDIAALRAGTHTRESLLAHCLDGVEDESTRDAWVEYVDAVTSR